jgi:putative phosphoesterase
VKASSRPFRIGVISDTHNYLDPQLAGIFAGVEHILHAGDIGQPRILLELERIAPVTAVGGNTDDPGFEYPHTQLEELGGHRFLLHHIVNPHSLTDSLRQRLARDRPAAVIFGHTHKPSSETLDGNLFFNPGYAGKSRFGLRRSVGLVHCEETRLRTEFVWLED